MQPQKTIGEAQCHFAKAKEEEEWRRKDITEEAGTRGGRELAPGGRGPDYSFYKPDTINYKKCNK